MFLDRLHGQVVKVAQRALNFRLDERFFLVNSVNEHVLLLGLDRFERHPAFVALVRAALLEMSFLVLSK